MESLVIYYAIFFICIFFSFKFEKKKIKLKIGKIEKNVQYIIYFIFSMGPLILLSGLRFEVGTDYSNYLGFYRDVKLYANSIFRSINSVEYLFYVFTYTSLKITENYQLFLSTCQIIICLLFFVSMMRDSKDFNASYGMMMVVFCCLVFAISWNAVRQVMAAGVIYYGQRYVKEERFLKYIVTVAVAGLFHTTALVCIGLYFLSTGMKVENKYKRYFSYFLLSVIMLVGSKGISVVQELVGIDKYAVIGESQSSIFKMLLIQLPLLIMFLMYHSTIVKEKCQYHFNLYILKLIIIIVLNSYQWGFRLQYFVLFAEIVLAGTISKNVDKKNRKKIYILITVYYLIVFGFNALKGMNGLIPYKSIL